MKSDLLYALLILVVLTVTGCASSEQPKVAAKEEDGPPRFSKDVGLVGSVYRTNLFLAHPNLTSRLRVLNLSNKLYLGDDVDRALEVFGPPPRAYDVTDLPPGWKEQGYQAAGWETGVRPKGEAAVEGFGLVLQKDRVALALFTVEHADGQLFSRITSDYQDELKSKPTAVANKRSQYRFWTIGDQVLMVSTTSARSGEAVTVAIGAKALMDGLRMNPDRAKEDIQEAERLLATRQEPVNSQ